MPAMDRANPPSPRTSRRVMVSWAAWDWGSAAFNAVATSFVFSVYLTSDGTFASSATANSYLSMGMTIAGLAVALLAPITGQRADQGGGLRSFAMFSFGVFAAMAAMFFVSPDSSLGPITMLVIGVALLGIGNVLFEFSSVNYNAMLNFVSTKENRGRISGIGWGAGYIGGIALLLVLYFGFINPEVGLFGVTAAGGLNVRVSMLIAALWFGLFTIPLLLNPPEGYGQGSGERTRRSLADGYRELFALVRHLYHTAPDTLRFLIASAVFRDGLAGVFTFGGVIAGAVFGFTGGQVILFAIAANLVAGVSTIVAGRLDDSWGPKRVIVLSLSCMIVAGIGVFLLHDRGPLVFWVLGLLLTVFVGPAQSASRSLLSRIIPDGRESELFGLYATSGRAVSFLAPLLYGIAIWLGGRLVPATVEPTYWGILGIALILLVGLALLLPVRVDRVKA